MFMYLTTDAYERYVATTGEFYDEETGLLAITEAQYKNLKPQNFNIGAADSYSLSRNAHIWPRAQLCDWRKLDSHLFDCRGCLLLLNLI